MNRQDSLYDQLKTVYQLAVDRQCYDAADFIKRHIDDIEGRLADGPDNLKDAFKL